jgi:4-amino-4-deoxy-L-arabinose transferase-like glycosyltransferase
MPRVSVLVLAAALVFVVLFWHLGTPTFWDPDEAHYAETTREMVAAGDWWAPYYNEQPFFDKPVLFHQLQGAAMVLVRDPELAARLVPALAALGLVGITAWFGAAMVSTEVGLVAALMLAASPGVFGLARYAILDTLFTMFTFGSAACLGIAALRDRPRLQWPGYVLLALGVLTKGPIALVLCGLAFVLLVAASANVRTRLLGLHWILGLTLIVALSAPWFLYMYLRFRQDFVDGYILDENLRLFAGSRFTNQPGFSFYFQILAAGLLPWTGLLAGRLIDDVRAVWRGERIDAVETMLWAWTAAIIGFFTLSTFKLDHYVFPASPALCLLCARAWSDLRAHQPAQPASAPRGHRHAATRVGLHSVGPLLLVVGLASGYLLITRLDLPPAAASVPAGVALAGAGMIARVSVRWARLPDVPSLAIVGMIALYIGVVAFVLPALEQRKIIPDLAQWVASRARADDRIASFQLNRWNPAYRFYVGRHTAMLDDPAAATAFFNAPEPFYCVMRRDAFDALVAQGAALTILYEREGMSVTSGRVLWRRHNPLTRYVVVSRAR